MNETHQSCKLNIFNFEELNEHFKYDFITGDIIRIKSKRSDFIGKVSNRFGDGYLKVSYKSKNIGGHRLAWLLHTGKWPVNLIDHINGDRLDNRFSNLREATNKQNIENQTKPSSNNTTGFLGVSFHKSTGKFVSHISVDYKKKHLGYYNTALEAYNAYLEAKRKYHKFTTI